MVLKATSDSRYSSSGSSSFTGSKECGDFNNCRAICDRIIEGSASRCYRFSIDIVEDMEKALFTIRNIDNVERVDIDPYIFEAILTADKRTISELVEEENG